MPATLPVSRSVTDAPGLVVDRTDRNESPTYASENQFNSEWSESSRVLRAKRRQRRFNDLAETWRRATLVESNVTMMVTHPAYQEIIGMGDEVVPLVLEDLQNEPDHWFWALRAITGEDPIPDDATGDIRAMADAWIEWGRDRGYL